MNIVICDDEKVQRELLSKIVSDFFESRNMPYTIREYASAEELLFHHEQNQDFDILLLDIQMKAMNGVQLAEKLRSQNNHAAIIFVTGDPDYVFDGYRVEAVNYLLKPVHESKVIDCLEKAMEKQIQEKMIILSCEQGLVKIKQNDILHIQSDGHYLNLTTTHTTYRSKKRLKDMEQELTASQFYRVGKSDIVNLEFISRITSKEIILMNQTIIPIPKGKYRHVSEAFMNFHFHGGNAQC